MALSLVPTSHFTMVLLPSRVPFNGVTCEQDFAKLHSIFTTKFKPHDDQLYFNDLLEYLKDCLDGDNSNDEAIVAFIINHPCLQSYLERMA